MVPFSDLGALIGVLGSSSSDGCSGSTLTMFQHLLGNTEYGDGGIFGVFRELPTVDHDESYWIAEIVHFLKCKTNKI